MIPKQVHPMLRDKIKDLPDTWEVIKKRDHYFLLHEGKRVACVGNNSSGCDDKRLKRNLHTIEKYMEKIYGPDNP